ncbi:MAG: DUF4349 domain-containing protein [Eubacteriales bacterium]|nr:DUF4349 domain-containing protein [Eubacteriales bacterium]
MRKERAGAILLALMTAVLAGCGASSSGTEMAADSASSYSGYEANSGSDVDYSQVAENRKLIRNVDMSVETEQFEELVADAEKKAEELGGYVENSSIYNGSETSDYRSRSARLTARIPAEQLDSFLESVSAWGNVTDKSEYTEDVTLQYVDLESHKKALRAEQESLLAMLEKAETIEEIISINQQLTEVRYQIESMESQLRTYDNQIAYSTVNLNIDEVEFYRPYEEKTAWERISSGFLLNLRRVGNGLKNFAIEFVIALPILVTAAAILAVLALVLRALIKAEEKRNIRRRERIEQRKREADDARQTAKGGLRGPGGPSQRGQVHPDEPSDRPEDRNHLQ